MIKKSNL